MLSNNLNKANSNKDDDKKKKRLLIIIFIILEIIIIGLIIWFLIQKFNKKGNVIIADKGDAITTEVPPSKKSISFAGYGTATVSKNAKAVPLSNPKGNTVYMYYRITKTIDTIDCGTFDGADEAYKYVNEKSQDYEPYLDKETNTYCYLVGKDKTQSETRVTYKVSLNTDGTASVIATTDKLLYFTNAIEPGVIVGWNAYDALSAGEHVLNFISETEDMETLEKCTPVSRQTVIIVDK